MVSVFGTPKLVSGYAMSLRDILERNSIKHLIFFVWKLISSFFGQKISLQRQWFIRTKRLFMALR